MDFIDFTTSTTEIIDIAKAWILISLAFAIALVGFASVEALLGAFLIAAGTLGVGFIFHELAHKITAQRIGYNAEFRASDQMLLMALLMSLLGFVFAAPGAVIIQGVQNERENGRIAAAGVAGNLVVPLAFLILFYFSPSGDLGTIFSYGFLINSWIGLFNLIPVGPFDGKKMVAWNKKLYGALALVALIFLFIGGLYVFRWPIPIVS
jgi:Zn-dependent protease